MGFLPIRTFDRDTENYHCRKFEGIPMFLKGVLCNDPHSNFRLNHIKKMFKILIKLASEWQETLMIFLVEKLKLFLYFFTCTIKHFRYSELIGKP